MAVVLTSANLNVRGNAGQYETDPSTWGYTTDYSTSRSNLAQTAGLYSAKLVNSGGAAFDTPPYFGAIINISFLARARVQIDPNKKYIASCNVRIPAAYQLAPNICPIHIRTELDGIGTNFIEETSITVANCLDDWKTVTLKFNSNDGEFLSISPGQFITLSLIISQTPLGGQAIAANGTIFIDQFEVYEYIDGEEGGGGGDEGPDPSFEKVWFSKNPIPFQAAAAPGWEALTNVRIYNDVTIDEDTDGTFVSAGMPVDLPPDIDGNVVFNNRPAFADKLKAIPPALNADVIINLTDRIKFFKNNTAQLQDLETTPEGDPTESAQFIVLMGGLSKLAWASIGSTFFSAWLPANKKFLTWAPLTKPVARNQEDYLNYFVFDEATVALQLQIKVYFDDGTNQTSIVDSITGVVKGQLYQLPAGPANTGAALIDPAKNLVKYELALLDQDDSLISEVRIFILDAFRHPLQRLFMFLNSLGSYEVLRFNGAAEHTAVVGKTEIIKFLPYNYSALDGEREVNQATLRESDNYSTGYFEKDGAAWQDYMKDFLLSSRVFEVTDGRRIPVSISAGSFPLGADHNFQFFVRFTALDSYEDESYTPKSIA